MWSARNTRLSHEHVLYIMDRASLRQEQTRTHPKSIRGRTRSGLPRNRTLLAELPAIIDSSNSLIPAHRKDMLKATFKGGRRLSVIPASLIKPGSGYGKARVTVKQSCLPR